MTAQHTTHTLDVPGARLFYEVRGSGPLLLVIGQPMTSEPFAPLAGLLAHDRTVVTYDPRGLGRSTVADPALDVTPETEADDLARIVDAVGGGPADVFGSSGGAVAGLALLARHPDRVRTLVAHEPPVTELLPDAAHVRAVVDGIEEAYRTADAGAAWGRFVSLVVHDGPVGPDGVPAVPWPPQGQDAEEAGSDSGSEPDAGGAGAGAGADESDPAAEAPGSDVPESDAPDPGPSAKQRQDDEMFFLRMCRPFARWQPPVDTLRAHDGRVVVAVGEASRREVARRSADALAERLGVATVPFPGDHGGFMADPEGFADALRRVLARTS